MSILSITFSCDKLFSFFRCLCDNRKQTCSQTYRASWEFTSHFYVYGLTQSENLTHDEEPGNTFVCDPGDLGPGHKQFLSCYRWSDASNPCDGARICQSYHVTLNYEDCDSKCLELDWIDNPPTGVKFNDEYPDMKAGRGCDRKNSDPSSGREGDVGDSSGVHTVSTCPSLSSDSGYLVAAVVVGWALVAVLMGIIIIMAYIIHRSRTSTSAANPDNLQRPLNDLEDDPGSGLMELGNYSNRQQP